MKKPKKRTTRKEDAGKYLLDISKLVFGSICLGGVLRGEVPHVILTIGGLAGAATLFIIGLSLVEKEKTGENSPPAKSPINKNGGE